MKRNVVCTITVGDFYEKLAHSSHPPLHAYAEKCGADFVVWRELKTKVPGYTKFEMVRTLLASYERVLFVDTDALVRFDCPNLFELYGPEVFVAFNEEHIFPERRASKADFCAELGLPPPEQWLDSKQYFNTGVFLCSRRHRNLFAPHREIDHFGEQTALNYQLFEHKTDVVQLPHRFNRLVKTLRLSGECFDDSYIAHFAGGFVEEFREPNYRTWLELANRFKRYRAENAVPEFPRRIYIQCTGGLGDVVSHEPVVRYIRKRLDTEADITIRTAFPEVFAHLAEDPRTRIAVTGEKVADEGHMILNLLPDPPFANYNQMHPVDYAALAAIKGHLPESEKGIQLKVNAESFRGIEDYVLVHPGKSWQSKTFPRAYWQEIIDGLCEFMPVAIIGKTYPPEDVAGRGTVDVDASKCLDMRNQLNLGQLFANIRDAAVLLSNDSSPVHIAGAFKTPVVMITSAKPAEFIFPHRDKSLNFALGRPIKGNEIGVVNHVVIDKCTMPELLSVLPEPREVIETTLKAFRRSSRERIFPGARSHSRTDRRGLRGCAPIES